MIKYYLPFYHAVSEQPLAHINALYPSKTLKEFKTEIDFFARKCDLVSLAEFRELANNNFESVKRPIAHITFDDGLREVDDVIAPILSQKGIPATFFINTGFIDNRDLFFRYKISLIIEKIVNASDTSIKEIGNLIHLKDTSSIEKHLLLLKYDQKELIDSIANVLEIDFTNYLRITKPYLSTEQIKNLIKNGFNIGAHSIDHPEFRYINKEEQIRQVKESVEAIQKIDPIAIKAFSFPFTDYGVSNETFTNLYSNNIIDISFGTAGIKNDSIKMNFQRIPMETGHLLAQIMIKESGKHYLRRLMGINTIKRN